MNENIIENLESVSNSDGVSVDNGDSSWNGSVVSTSGSDSQIPELIPSGDTGSPNVWTGDTPYVGYSASGGDASFDTPSNTETLMEIQKANAESNAQIIDNLSSINGLLVLIFAFLLFEWTEKKINVTVNRFSNKRR